MKELTVGFVRGSHGLSGEVKVESASGRYGHIAKLEEVTLRRNDFSLRCKVEYTRESSSDFYMKFVGVDSPEEAKKLNRAEIRTSRENACPLGEDEWYIEDLKTCSLVWGNDGGTGKTIVGSVTGVLEGGAGDLLEVSLSEDCNVLDDSVKKTAAGKPRTVFVPFNKVYIGEVDIESKTIELMHLWILE